mgnify:CR=1 FL=1|jgi:hypothetical protein
MQINKYKYKINIKLNINMELGYYHFLKLNREPNDLPDFTFFIIIFILVYYQKSLNQYDGNLRY